MRSGQPRTSWWLGSMTPEKSRYRDGGRGQNRGIWTGWQKHTREAPALSRDFTRGHGRLHAKYKWNDCVHKRIMLPFEVEQGTFQMESDPSQDGRQVGWLTRSAPTNYSFLRTNHTTGLKTPQHLPTKCQKLNFYHITDHKNIHLALHRELMMSLCGSKQIR